MRVPLLVAALLLLLSAPGAHARPLCTCTNGGPILARQMSAAVFVGRVVSNASETGDDRWDLGETLVAHFEVRQAIKGASRGDTISVRYRVGNGADCYLPALRPGASHLVYASVHDSAPGLWTGGCGRVKLLRCAEPDLRALGEEIPPDAGDCEPRDAEPHVPATKSDRLRAAARGIGFREPEECAVVGFVRDELSLQPVMGAHVGVEGSPLQVATDSTGRYLVRSVKPGRYTLLARADGYDYTEKREVGLETGLGTYRDASRRLRFPCEVEVVDFYLRRNSLF